MSIARRPSPALQAMPPGKIKRFLRVVAASIASILAFLTGAIMLGAYFPAIPKAGVIGPVIGGQYPFHLALLALAGAALGALAWRSGLVRWGRVLTAVTALSATAGLVIGSIQFVAARDAGTKISFSQVFGQLATSGVLRRIQPRSMPPVTARHWKRIYTWPGKAGGTRRRP